MGVRCYNSKSFGEKETGICAAEIDRQKVSRKKISIKISSQKTMTLHEVQRTLLSFPVLSIFTEHVKEMIFKEIFTML